MIHSYLSGLLFITVLNLYTQSTALIHYIAKNITNKNVSFQDVYGHFLLSLKNVSDARTQVVHYNVKMSLFETPTDIFFCLIEIVSGRRPRLYSISSEMRQFDSFTSESSQL
jgi:hypothetical protein